MKHVLMIAYLFPPAGGIGSAGAQRVLKFVKYLPSFHWHPIVLTIKEKSYESYFTTDPTLMEKVPPGLPIVRTSVVRWLTRLLELRQTMLRGWRGKAQPQQVGTTGLPSSSEQSIPKGWYHRLKDTITDMFEIPDEAVGWFVPAVVGGWRAIRRDRIDVIFSTGRPWTAHLIGTALKIFTHKPLVVDFRDPWMTNPFRLDYSPVRNRLEAFCERKVIEYADVVIANTDELRGEFIRRFPCQPKEKFMTLLNGFDPEDYAVHEHVQDRPRQCFTIAHTGFLYGKRDPKPFFEALEMVMACPDVDRSKLRVVFVGSIQLSYDLPAYLAAHNLQDLVILHGQVTYKQSLQYMKEGDLLLLLQPGTSTQVPSKLFEYIAFRKPILAITPVEGATGRLVTNDCSGFVCAPEQVSDIANAIEVAYRQWKRGGVEEGYGRRAYDTYNVKNMTAVLASAFSEVSSDEYAREEGEPARSAR